MAVVGSLDSGRWAPPDAIAFVAVDVRLDPETLERIAAIPQVKRVRAVAF